MLDLTPEIQLDSIWKKRYFFLKIFIYAVFVIGGLYFSYIILFPGEKFLFDFSAPDKKTTSIFYIRTPQGTFPKNGIITGKTSVSFDTFLAKDFSQVNIKLVLSDDSSPLENGEIKIKKSYKTFSYPLAEKPAVFKTGMLIKNNGNYYIVSDNKLRKFSSFKIAGSLGYEDASFTEAAETELNFSDKGDNIANDKIYPDDSLFSVDDDYYQLKNQEFRKFLSQNAFLSYYEKNMAITKEKSFLNQYPISQEAIGFADGTLLSFDTSAYIISQGELRPFNNPVTFLSFGFAWKDLVSATEDEIGFYQRGKIFEIQDPHPDGTIFFARDNGKYYLTENGMKKEIRGENILKSYRKRDPIPVDEQNLNVTGICTTKKNFLGNGQQYDCRTDLQSLEKLIGNNYQFEMQTDPEISIRQMDIVFSQKINWSGARDTLSEIKNRIFFRYGSK